MLLCGVFRVVVPENYREHLTNSDQDVPIQKSNERDYRLQIQINFHLAKQKTEQPCSAYKRGFYNRCGESFLGVIGGLFFKKVPLKYFIPQIFIPLYTRLIPRAKIFQRGRKVSGCRLYISGNASARVEFFCTLPHVACRLSKEARHDHRRGE